MSESSCTNPTQTPYKQLQLTKAYAGIVGKIHLYKCCFSEDFFIYKRSMIYLLMQIQTPLKYKDELNISN